MNTASPAAARTPLLTCDVERPGDIEQLVRQAADHLGGLDFAALMQRARERAPLRRLVTLAEIGQLAAFLAGDAASGLSGQTIYVDGGYHAVN
jgi:enoyl-[acyl-carrier-protein] reductase (NADH)